MSSTTPPHAVEPMQPAKKHCRMCDSLISAAATKCIKCDSYQDWRRYLSVGETSLSLLVALIAVLGSLASQLGPLFNTPKDSIQLQLANCSPERMTVSILASNTGQMAGVLRSAKLTAPADSASFRSEWDLRLDPGQSNVIKPEESFTFDVLSEYILPQVVSGSTAPTVDSKQWTLSAVLVHSDGQAETVNLVFLATEPAGVGTGYPLVRIEEVELVALEDGKTRSPTVADLGSVPLQLWFHVRPQAFGPAGMMGLEIESLVFHDWTFEQFILLSDSAPFGSSGESSTIQTEELERVDVTAMMNPSTWLAVPLDPEYTDPNADPRIDLTMESTLILRDIIEREIGSVPVPAQLEQ